MSTTPVVKVVDATDCPSCGAPSVGGLDGCRAEFDRLGEREFSDPDHFRTHRLTVDAYSLDAADYERLAMEWARSAWAAWAAWAAHWGQARAWVQEAFAESRRDT